MTSNEERIIGLVVAYQAVVGQAGRCALCCLYATFDRDPMVLMMAVTRTAAGLPDSVTELRTGGEGIATANLEPCRSLARQARV